MACTIAVIDIGMTNKKVAVYEWPEAPGEGKPRCLVSVSRSFAPVMVDGLETHDLAGMEEWFIASLRDFSKKFDMRAVAVSTHGATFVCVDALGNPCVPCVFYTHEPGPAFQEHFYEIAGIPEELQAVTGTPVLSALINPAKGILFAKERFPDAFSRTSALLNYPQYWGFRLTGMLGAEGTYVGCHTYLWDWPADTYSSVARVLGVDELMPRKIAGSAEVLGTLSPSVAAATGMHPETLVTMGIHDSNASLVPHMVKRSGREFVLNSTGTWCVLMHPCTEYRFESDELGKVVFFNRSVFNKPVKTAIFLGGFEYGQYATLMSRTCGKLPVRSAESVYRKIVAEKRLFILPEIVPGSGQFPGSSARVLEDGIEYRFEGMAEGMDTGSPADSPVGKQVPRFFSDPETAQAVLTLSLVAQTVVALERCGLKPGFDLFTEGGFRNNPDYCAILAAVLPANQTWLTDLAEATSFGAAMTAVSALSSRPLEEFGGDFDIEYVGVTPMGNMEEFAAYMDVMLGLMTV